LILGIPFLIYQVFSDVIYVLKKSFKIKNNNREKENKYFFDAKLYTVLKRTTLFFLLKN
jgi:hypothetical protein